MRTFIALEVNDEVKRCASEIIEKLMRRGFRANWVSPENMHLTLFFLGEVRRDKVDEIAEHLCRRVRGFPSFSFTVEGFGYFKKGGAPRVFWLGVEATSPLLRLYEELRNELSHHGFSFEEKFVPHITIGRVKYYPEKWEKLVEDLTFPSTEVAVDSFKIFSSTLTPEGPIYKAVYECQFEGGLIRNE